jgi:sortase A
MCPGAERVALAARQIERFLWVVGVACGGYLLFVAAQAQVFHHRAEELSVGDVVAAPVRSGAVLGRIDIPALHLSAAVLEDDQSKSLLRGLGHIRGTAELGGLGNVGLAGHRDTFLRSLRMVTPGIQIRATSVTGTYHYVVDSTEILTSDPGPN